MSIHKTFLVYATYAHNNILLFNSGYCYFFFIACN